MATIDVQVYFDSICAWCYIGEKSFERAVELYQRTYPGGSKDTIRLQWLPYYLNANASDQGVPLLEQMLIRNGSQQRVHGVQTRVQRAGLEHGITFSFAGKVGKTRDSHRLVLFAGTKSSSIQTALVNQIFRDHFEGTMDITSHADLTVAAVAAGLEEAEAAAVLLSDRFGDEADRLAAKAREDGVNSVPTYVIGDRRVEGAESVSEFYEALMAAKEAGVTGDETTAAE